MLTPVDINKKEFRRAMRGYNEHEVDSFLDQVARDYETILRQKLELEDVLQRKEDQIQQYRNLEETLNSTLVMAQKTAEELKQNAAREAELLLREARAEAENIIRQAASKKEAIEQEQSELRQSLAGFRAQMRAFLKAQLEMVENLPVDDSSE
ncbi:MAG: DivIVA domain-containing protein [Syntrophomonadaceae bacterium]|nr:DivIVA domain-containing protein [Syntrophomonadaceae bacterium]